MSLESALEEIDIILEACAETPDDILVMDLEELEKLILFEQSLRATANRLLKVISQTARMGERGEEPVREGVNVGGVISSMDHPVIRRLQERRIRARDLGARIRRKNIEVVK